MPRVLIPWKGNLLRLDAGYPPLFALTTVTGLEIRITHLSGMIYSWQ
jgi:hypothetical protein